MSVVVRAKDQIEVFVNDAGTITISQQSGMDEPDLIAVHPEDVYALYRALRIACLEIRERGL